MLENSGLYWHLVDLIWIFLFPLLYLITMSKIMKQRRNTYFKLPSHTIVLVILLVLTTISVLVTGFHLGALTVAVALVIASVKVSIVITYFMHVKFESLFLKLLMCRCFCALYTGYHYNIH